MEIGDIVNNYDKKASLLKDEIEIAYDNLAVKEIENNTNAITGDNDHLLTKLKKLLKRRKEQT